MGYKALAFAVVALTASHPLLAQRAPERLRPVTTTTKFLCADGKAFSVVVRGKSAFVETVIARYVLRARPSSIGQFFVADGVAFAVDEDRGVLVAPGEGPYQTCVAKAD